ncbi:response regulator transcription factor [Variovorax ginsengisoli]|uniref:DNA-binding response OmpR family regulator n=1 Tax=Variovorax ginsengisoli TaxID=363844 RepID=A0ABT9S581_9BURK|nr:response regulator transcription factor [Variovorax ginsengisoli]MDP9899515.1 DNA-binding response OmpR family regulator [Variovorax ginsengisoli]
MMRIAVLEEDTHQRVHLIKALSQQMVISDEHIAICTFDNGEALRRAIRVDTFDLLILDWIVPDLDGIDLLRWLRDSQKDTTPVLMLSAQGSERQVVQALDEGANDYVVKPFRTLELCARVRRLLKQRRDSTQAKAITQTPLQERYGAWLFDRGQLFVEFSARAGERAQKHCVTDREFRMALALFRHIGQPVSRSYLLEQSSYRGENLSSRALDSHIYRLRSKLGLHPANGIRLQTVYGQGYRLEWVRAEE